MGAPIDWQALADGTDEPSDPASLADIRLGLARQRQRWSLMLAERGWGHLGPDEIDERLEHERLGRDFARRM
jgi:hypothetical protein